MSSTSQPSKLVLNNRTYFCVIEIMETDTCICNYTAYPHVNKKKTESNIYILKESNKTKNTLISFAFNHIDSKLKVVLVCKNSGRKSAISWQLSRLASCDGMQIATHKFKVIRDTLLGLFLYIIFCKIYLHFERDMGRA